MKSYDEGEHRRVITGMFIYILVNFSGNAFPLNFEALAGALTDAVVVRFVFRHRT